MLIGGLQKTTLVDYPGKVAATVFTLGCSFRCHFCHNPELVLPEQFNKLIPEQEVLDFFANRVGKLEGVCITGGEPTIQKDIVEFMLKLKALGFAVKLDTNGTMPKVVRKILDAKAVDYFAMDIKGPAEKYAAITAKDNFLDAIKESIQLIRESGIPYEFRTTIAKPLHEVKDFHGIGKLIKGSDKYFIQNFVLSKQVDDKMTLKPFSEAELNDGLKIISAYVKEVHIR
jgi:pyruvate formate lyase activating enzyme